VIAFPASRQIALACALAAALMLIAGCAEPPVRTAAERQKLDELLTLIKARLEFAEYAARDAWAARRPLDQPAREDAVIATAVNRAFELALPPELVREFFRAQIEAAKHVQSTLFAQWQAQSGPAAQSGHSALEQLRPRVEPSNASLLAALAQVYPILTSAGGKRLIEQCVQDMLKDLPGGATTALLAIAPLWSAAK
jgi:chorismate mutase-like protein